MRSPNLTWNNTNNTLSASNFIDNGSQLTSLNVSNHTLMYHWEHYQLQGEELE